MKIRDYIGIYPNMVPLNLCDDIIGFFEQNSQFHIKRPEQDKTEINDTAIFLSERNFGETALNFNYPIKMGILNSLELYQQEFDNVKLMFRPGNNLYIDEFKIQRTLPGEGFHGFHAENTTYATSDRVLVYTLYLNNIEEGGETEFLYQNKRISPQKGTICIFPAYFTHVHRGNPPLNQSKYIVTGWINIIDEKYSYRNNLNFLKTPNNG